MKQFNLDEYLKDPSRKVVTRDGKSVRIICTDREEEYYPLLALLRSVDRGGSSFEAVVCYTRDGRYSRYLEDDLDLFFAPEKKEGWISIYKTESGDIIPGNYIDKSEKVSRERSVPYRFSTLIKTIKIEWEE